MDVILEKDTNDDAQSIFDMQVKAFMPLLEKYKDYDTNPANETIDRVFTRINNPNGGFYKICLSTIVCETHRILTIQKGKKEPVHTIGNFPFKIIYQGLNLLVFIKSLKKLIFPLL
ncbi:GNAT family N-acetyltransferase [Bacillus sp. IB182487]|uniref:GNAT family N-acetyltransferase n=1 Tax=Metabacillus arenae TaxID=2771434 RepID=A0A926RXX5_9BACI|nr:GNAT family N-acetyltransferase [Metabacillus arenae]